MTNDHHDLAAQIAAAIAPLIASVLSPKIEHEHDLLPLDLAAQKAATSKRVVRDAIRAGELPAYGGQRDRSVRRGDLERWIESRKVIHLAIDDDDIERRMRRIGGSK